MTDTSDEARERIAALRTEIDAVDCEIVRLLNRRAELSLEIRPLKPKVQLGLYDPKREEEIFTHLASCNEGPLFADNLREIYESILHVMKELPE